MDWAAAVLMSVTLVLAIAPAAGAASESRTIGGCISGTGWSVAGDLDEDD